MEKQAKENEQERRNKGNLELSEKIARARALRSEELAKLEEEEKQMATQRMFLGAAKNMIEEQHFDDQLRGAEREAQERQLKAKQVTILCRNSGFVTFGLCVSFDNDLRTLFIRRPQ